MTNLSVIILVGREALHIQRCLEKLAPLEPRQIFVVESQKGDRTHEIAVETAKCLNWRVEECLNERGVGERCTADGRRAMAEKKVAEWLAGVDEATFEAALAKLVEEKTAVGEYRFKKPEEYELALAGARRFFREFSRKIIELSDGRCVYFAPDPRSRARHSDNAVSWAEYAFHAVSSSGQLMADSLTLRERWFNHNKHENLVEIERIIREEHGIYRLIDAHPENDAVIFVGMDAQGWRMEVVSRLDEYGNAEANLGEVTVVVRHKGKKEIPPPKFRPLTEVVEAVAKHQAAGFSPSTTGRSLANCRDAGKGVGESLGVGERCRCTADGLSSSNQTIKQSNNQTVLTMVWHGWPGTQAAQFDWSLDYVEGRSKKEEGRGEEEEGRSGGEWILRLDADEYLSEELIAEIKEKLPEVSASVYGIRLRLERIWQGREIRHATNGIMQVRMFRRGKGRYLATLMDERLVTGDWTLVDGEWQLKQSDYPNNPTIDFQGAFYDASLLPLDEWKSKQLGYAKREALQAMSGTSQDWRKRIYYLPIFAPIRPFAYFCIRYFLRLGFLDGRAGWSWNYWQALWYRTQVEREIRKLKNLSP